MKTWNKEQEKALTLRDCNILVSAGAGSGKTAVLTERIVRLIEEGNSILDFAVCTFTEDATLEMKNRIRERLLEKGLDTQADMVYMADISTIHSLCKKIVADNFDAVGLPPKFSVLSNEAVQEEQAITAALNELFEDKEFTAFALKFSPNDDTRIKELILSAYHFCCNIPDYDSFLEKQSEMYGKRDYSFIEKSYCRLKSRELKQMSASYDLLFEDNPLTEKELMLIESDRELLRNLTEQLDEGRLTEEAPSFAKMPPKQPNKEAVDRVRKRAKALVKEIVQYKAVLDCDEIMEEAGKDLEMLRHALAVFDRIYSETKLKGGYLTFNDLERYAYRILEKEEVCDEYKKRYKYIFVDEYQDTSRLQQAILDRIRGERNMFMVGDIKQSIYGFRNADPTMFHKVYGAYGDTGRDIRIDLFRNYRSGKNILDFVNDIFSVLLNMNEEYYQEGAYLLTDINEDETPVEIDLVTGEDRAVCEARQIVRRIEECIDEGVSYRDIAVLFRSLKGEVPSCVHRMLRDRGIPVDMSSGSDEMYMETRIFADLISIIDNCDNDIPLLSVMFSPVGSFSVSDLIEIKKSGKNSFYRCVKSYKGDKELENKLKEFFDMLAMFSEKSRRMAVDELMAAVLMHTGYLKHLEKDGKAKTGQIYQLIRSAKEFEAMGYYGISGFLTYFEALKELKKAPETAGFVQGSNAVSLMTMHKSKGLEFPVVIIGGLNKQMYHKGDEGYYVFHKDMGVGLSHIDTERRVKIQTPMMALIKEQKRVEDLDEQMRMLYVAMTRAKNKLYIVSGIDDEKTEKTPDLRELTGGGATYLQAVMTAISLRRTSGISKYSINRLHMDDKAERSEIKLTEPLFDERVTEILNSKNDTSTVIVPKKAAVTALTKEENVFVPYRAKGKQKSNDAALAGTVTHNLLFHLREGESFDVLMERMREGEFFTEQELSLADKDMIEGFMASGLSRRIGSAKKVYREKPFILEMDKESGFTDEPVMVQGIIDCLFEEEDGIVLVDYKTDNVVKNAESILREKYAGQLDLYSFAVSSLTGKKVKEKIIFHLKTNKEIHL